jgi:hypothetical protein
MQNEEFRMKRLRQLEGKSLLKMFFNSAFLILHSAFSLRKDISGNQARLL